MRFLFMTAILCCVVGIPAMADPAAAPPLMDFLMQPTEKNMVMYNVEQQWKRAVDNCTKPHLDRTSVIVMTMPEFNADGVPTSGAWRVVNYVGGCGEQRALSLLYYFNDNGKMVRAALLPGTTAADPALQREAVMYADTAMRIMIPDGCKTIQYMDTEFAGFGPATATAIPGRDPRSWTEKWTLNACGVKGLVTMHFVPNITGIAISTSADETKLLNAP